jgi:shikimate kinase
LSVTVRSSGAVSLLNAIPSGVGSAMGVELPIEVTVKESESLGLMGDKTDGLIETTWQLLEGRLKRKSGIEYSIRSEVPASRGLKSSSGLTIAFIAAVSRLFDMNLTDEEMVKISANSSIAAGVSVTGSYDDAYAALLGGIVLTDSRSGQLIRRTMPPDGIEVLIAYNARVKPIVDPSRYRDLRDESMVIWNLILHGGFGVPIVLNGLMVSAICGYDSKPLINGLAHGALSCGVSGTGPSIFFIAKDGDGHRLESILRSTSLRGWSTILVKPRVNRISVSCVGL